MIIIYKTLTGYSVKCAEMYIMGMGSITFSYLCEFIYRYTWDSYSVSEYSIFSSIGWLYDGKTTSTSVERENNFYS